MERNERFSYRAMQMHGDMRMMVCYQIWWVCVRLQCVVYNRNHQWASKRLCSHHYYLYTVQWGLRWRQRCVLAGVCLRLDDVTVLAHIYSHHKSLLMNTSHGAYYTTMTLISMGRELSHNTQTDMLARAAHTIFNHSSNATLKRIDVLLVRACTHVQLMKRASVLVCTLMNFSDISSWKLGSQFRFWEYQTYTADKVLLGRIVCK